MAKPKKSKFWTEEQAHRVLDRADASNLSDRRYAEKHGLHPQRLCWWRAKLGRGRRRGGKARRNTTTRFVEVKGSVPAAVVLVEVALRNGRRVTLSTETDLEWMARLLDVVEGLRC